MSFLFRQRKKTTRQTPAGLDVEIFPDVPLGHRETFESVRSATMTSASRVFALCDAVEYLCNARIPGDIVECGVWKGGSMMAAATTLLQMDSGDRRLWLFDTFDGMSEPGELDVDHSGHSAATLLAQASANVADSIWCKTAIEEVQHNIQSTRYPGELVEYIIGDVQETLHGKRLPEKIALLRLDTDWYESTLVELKILFPRLVTGGVLIIDDYGHWQGCRRAVDEYFQQDQVNMLLNRIDYTGRIGIKQYPARDGGFVNVS